MKIVFMGTPDFAVPALARLMADGHEIGAVITAPDKPSGRGLKVHQSAVKEFALQHNLSVLQPEKLKNQEFIETLKAINAELHVVVAFRMLPEVVWNMPPQGTINLHASLLPQYRGAAPINYAIINGETTTGVTTFFLQHEIDTGSIIMQQSCSIDPDETAGELHHKLMKLGADVLSQTVQNIENGNVKAIPQTDLVVSELKTAHKIFKENCRVKWNSIAQEIHNLIRGLSPYPTAFTNIITHNGEAQVLKLFKANFEIATHNKAPGSIVSDGKNIFKVACNNGFIHILQLQLAGKKMMTIHEFLRGYDGSKIKIME